MKKNLIWVALATLALAGCHKKAWFENDGIPVIPEPEPVITYEGEGKLLIGESGSEQELNSTYSWKADEENGIQIIINIDTQQYVDGDDIYTPDWQIGHFYLDLNSINEFLGISVTEDLNLDNFYPVAKDGEGNDASWSSYKPGMWLDKNGLSGYGNGIICWQWYIWGAKDMGGVVYYDMADDPSVEEAAERTYTKYRGLVYLVSKPGSDAKAAAGSTVKSHNVIKLEDRDVNFDLTFVFGPYDDGGDDGYDHSDPQTALSGTAKLKADRETELEHQLSWTIAKEGIEFNCELSLAALGCVYHAAGDVETDEDGNEETYDQEGYYGGPYRVGYVKFDLGIFTDIIGKDITTLTDEEFYPCDAEGNKLTKRYTMNWDTGELVEEDYTGWTAFPGTVPGEWVTDDSRAANWSSGAAYWWINYDKEHKAEVDCEGALVIGNGPNVIHQLNQVVTSYNMCNGVPFKVNVKYVE